MASVEYIGAYRHHSWSVFWGRIHGPGPTPVCYKRLCMYVSILNSISRPLDRSTRLTFNPLYDLFIPTQTQIVDVSNKLVLD